MRRRSPCRCAWERKTTGRSFDPQPPGRPWRHRSPRTNSKWRRTSTTSTRPRIRAPKYALWEYGCMPLRVILLAWLTISPGFAQGTHTDLTFGGSGNDGINAAAVDSAGNVYVVGTTFSFDLPLRNAFQGANSGTQLIFSTDA